MSDDPNDYIDAAADVLGLRIEQAWKEAVRANLDATFRLARMVDEFALPDESEPAIVFRA